MDFEGCNPVTISVPRPDAPPEEEDMYVLSSNSSYPSFRVLTFGGRRTYKSPLRRRSYKEKPWQWDSLSPPPFPRDFRISCHAVLDDGVTICVTATCYNYGDDVVEEKSTLTCLFDTVKREWRPANGHH